MGLFTKDIRNMDDLFIHQLKYIYYGGGAAHGRR